MKSFVRLTLPLIVLVLSAYSISYAQDPQSNSAPPQDAPDLLGRLRLSPDQIQRIRLIQRDTKDERATIQQRLREANRALEESLDAENVDESVIDQRMQDVNAAQNAQLRLRIQTELRIRRILNPEQRAMLKDIRVRAGDLIKAQQNRRALRPEANGLRPNGNGVLPRRNDPLRNPRP
ncbi:MAG TPA: periplasmic heavy metal sensor [Pyrinomonadaceae bacterium]